MPPLVVFCFTLMLWAGSGALNAQGSRKIKSLQQEKKEMQQGLDRSQKELKNTEKAVTAKLRDINLLADRLENRRRYIDTMEVQLEQLARQVAALEDTVARTERELERKKEDYARALRHARVSRSAGSPLLFILSGRSVTQMYRRSRYAQEYANYRHTLAADIMQKRNSLLARKGELLAVKAEKNRLMEECLAQKALLQQQYDEEQQNVAGLQKRQKALKEEVEKQRRRLSELDSRIDELIAYEVEQARKRAEAARREAEEQEKGQGGSSSSSAAAQGGASSIPDEYKWITPQERTLNGSFVRNKGRLPVPITGSYMLGSRFGTYNVPGLKNVRLDNKGTNYIGRSGAMARSVFDGEVSAVFQFGSTKNVLVRHGSYISVYCNLSSVRVAQGQKVKARDILGMVEDDGAGHCVLHFQLRREKEKLNPEVWIGH